MFVEKGDNPRGNWCTTGALADCFQLIISVKEVLFSVCLGFCLLICQQDYTTYTQLFRTKLGGRMGHGPEKKTLNFGADPVKGADMTNQSFMLPDNSLSALLFFCYRS